MNKTAKPGVKGRDLTRAVSGIPAVNPSVEEDRKRIAAWLREYAASAKWSQEPEIPHFADHAADYIALGWHTKA